MNKIKNLLLLLCIAGSFAACKKSSSDNFDADAQLRTDTTAIRKYIVANNIPALKDKSGVFYQILAPGSGSVVYSKATNLTAAYEGRLLNGTVFDSSSSFNFYLGDLIQGWFIGIPYIQNGGKIRLIIPSYYGYGNKIVGPIPANSILDFTITLTSVK